MITALSLAFAGEGELPETVREAIEQVEETFGPDGEFKAVSTTWNDGSIDVRVYDAAQRAVFESHYPSAMPDGPHVRWWFATPVGGGETYSARIIDAEPPTRETMALAAKDIVRVARQTATAEPFGRTPSVEDTWGCDLPTWLGIRSTIECSEVGNCCDAHDGCYAKYRCTAKSWLNGYSDPRCLACNAFVVACITKNVGSTWLPSHCCIYGNCGKPRCTGARWADPTCVAGQPLSSLPILNVYPDDQWRNGEATWTSGSDGSVSYNGFYCFPDGTCLPCSTC
jgi:hypothetical protein